MATIWIYEPDDTTANKLCDFLERENHTPKRCNIERPDEEERDKPSLVVLDTRLKWMSCRPLFDRFTRDGCPILFITSDRQMSGHLRALYTGNSDVLTMPFTRGALKHKAAALISAGGPLRELIVDEQERAAILGDKRVELTAQEFALLTALMEKPDMPVSREQLLRKAWGYQSMGETRTVDVHVQRLRKKLGVEYIETVYKCGYRLRLV